MLIVLNNRYCYNPQHSSGEAPQNLYLIQNRSYMTRFVWHDLCEDDLILPAHGNEYVLKGSELFDEPNSGK